MSLFVGEIIYETKVETVNFIVPERIREACIYRGYRYRDASDKCGINYVEFVGMVKGEKEIPKEYIFKLMKGLEFPEKFFYQIKWGRV